MEYKFDNERPIYLQLVEILKIEIISGRIKVGDKLLSVRDYANEFKVNPNTMQKALLELEREKLIYTERTNGKYVTSDTKLINELKEVLARNLTKKYINDMLDIGVNKSSIIDYLKNEGND